MDRELSHAFMKRAQLKNRQNNFPTQENITAFKKQRNYCVSLLRKTKKDFYNNLDTKILGDSKKFWTLVKPHFTGKSKETTQITLIENNEMISEEEEVAEILNNNFVDAVANLGIEKSIYVEKVTDGH